MNIAEVIDAVGPLVATSPDLPELELWAGAKLNLDSENPFFLLFKGGSDKAWLETVDFRDGKAGQTRFLVLEVSPGLGILNNLEALKATHGQEFRFNVEPAPTNSCSFTFDTEVGHIGYSFDAPAGRLLSIAIRWQR